MNSTKLKYPLIVKRRKMCLMSLRDLAAKIGVSYQALSDYEHGKYPPNPEVFKKLKKALNLEGTIIDFFGREALKIKHIKYLRTERCKVEGCNEVPVCLHMCERHYSRFCHQRQKARAVES
jgi:transcriptional regulator with XRE-family HTH domain